MTDTNIIEPSPELQKIFKKLRNQVMKCSACSIVSDCKFPKSKIDTLKEKAKEISEKFYEEELELDNTAENKFRAMLKKDEMYKTYLKEQAYTVLSQEKCIFERREIIDIVENFINAGYNLADPRTSVIVTELIGNVLNSGRINRIFTSMGLVLRKESASGTVYYAHPLLGAKKEFSKLITESMQTLDQILKSDESSRTDNTFTSYLLTELKHRVQKDLPIEKKLDLLPTEMKNDLLTEKQFVTEEIKSLEEL